MTKERIQIPVLDIDIENSFEAISKFYHQLTERIKRDSHRKYIMMHFAEQSYYGKNKGEWILETCCKGFVIKNVRDFYRMAKIGKALLKTIEDGVLKYTKIEAEVGGLKSTKVKTYSEFYQYIDSQTLRLIANNILNETDLIVQFQDRVIMAGGPAELVYADFVKIIQSITGKKEATKEKVDKSELWKEEIIKLEDYKVEEVEVTKEIYYLKAYGLRLINACLENCTDEMQRKSITQLFAQGYKALTSSQSSEVEDSNEQAV